METLIKLLKALWTWLKSRSPYVLVIAVLVVIILLQQRCVRNPIVKNPETIVLIDTVRDTALIKVPEYVPKWQTKIQYVTATYEVYMPVDTDAIIADYLATYFYADTVIDDTSAFMVVFDSVSQNKIMSRRAEFRNRRPTQIITQTTILSPFPKWNIGVGCFVGGNSARFDAGIGIIYTGKRNALYQAEFNPFDKSFRVGMYWNLRKPK
jgi:hypothetical protein